GIGAEPRIAVALALIVVVANAIFHELRETLTGVLIAIVDLRALAGRLAGRALLRERLRAFLRDGVALQPIEPEEAVEDGPPLRRARTARRDVAVVRRVARS